MRPKPVLEIVPPVRLGPTMAPMVVATYRDPVVVETERHDTRAFRWKLHRIALASLALHSGLVVWNLFVAFNYAQEGRLVAAACQAVLAGGANVALVWWAWARAKRSFS